MANAHTPRASAHAQAFDLALVALFLAALAAPSLDHVLRPAGARSVSRENRRPAARPQKPFDRASVAAFPRAFESWFDDRLGLRDLLLRGEQALALFVFRSNPPPALVIWNEGWLYYGAESSMEVGRGLLPGDMAWLADWQRDLEANRDWVRERGAEFIFAIAPNKESIYPESLPASRARLGPTRLDQLAAWLAEHSDVRFLDLRAALSGEKAHDRPGDFVFHPLGSHWTWRGAWAGCNAILSAIHAQSAEVVPIPRAECVRKRLDEGEGDSFGSLMYVDDWLHQEVWAFPHVTDLHADLDLGREGSDASDTPVGEVKRLPRVVFVHDSFGPPVVSYLAERCAHLTSVRDKQLPQTIIAEEKPDIVVELFTERALLGRLAPIQADLVEIDRERFASGSSLWGPLDLGAKSPAIQTRGAITAVPLDGGLELCIAKNDGAILLPAVTPAKSHVLALHVDVTMPEETVMTLYYQLEGHAGFTRARAAELGLRAGRNDRYVRLDVPGLGGDVLLRLGRPAGRCILRALEARELR